MLHYSVDVYEIQFLITNDITQTPRETLNGLAQDVQMPWEVVAKQLGIEVD